MRVQCDVPACSTHSTQGLVMESGVGSAILKSRGRDVGTLTAPINASQEGGLRHYVWPPTGEKFPSVTTIINAVSKPALAPWAAKQAAVFAVQSYDQWKDLPQDEAIKLIAGASKRTTELASDIGNHVHECVEAVIGLNEVPNPTPEHMRHFDAWRLAFKPEFILSEKTVYNRNVCYAGTLDIVAEINGVTTLVDVKTGKSLWPETALQLSAYAHGEFIDIAGVETPMPKIEAAGILQLRMTGYKYVPIVLTDDIWRSFRHVNEVFRWQEYISRGVLGGKQ